MRRIRAGQVSLIAGLAALTASAALAADPIRLRRGLVVPVRFASDLSMSQNREGDRFWAQVANPRDLPLGTRFEGRIVRLEPERNGKPAHMDLEFDELVLPDGVRHRIQAVPIRMDDKSIRHGGDGRFTAKKKLEDSGKHILGGMIGGYLIGRILGDKHSEGILLGALAGILVAEGERNSARDGIVVRKDSEMGALIERDFSYEWNEQRDFVDRFRSEPRSSGNADGDLYDRLREGTYRGAPGQANRSEGPVFAHEGRPLQFDVKAAPYRDGEVWMVPLERTAVQLGLTVDGDTQSRRIYVENDDTVLVFEQESRTYRLNGMKATMAKNLTIKGEVIYVPIDAISSAIKGRITIGGTKV